MAKPEDNQKAVQELVWSARKAVQTNISFEMWQDNMAAQWALDRVSQKQLTCICFLIFVGKFGCTSQLEC